MELHLFATRELDEMVAWHEQHAELVGWTKGYREAWEKQAKDRLAALVLGLVVGVLVGVMI